MTNAQIILEERIKLMKAGTIGTTGRQFTFTDANGNEITLDEPEIIHTFAAWKELGYKVKKGEHAKAKFPVWKYKGKKEIDENGEEKETGRCFMKLAFFFTSDQVEKIA